jgi:hypothetical protein
MIRFSGLDAGVSPLTLELQIAERAVGKEHKVRVDVQLIANSFGDARNYKQVKQVLKA